MGNSSQFLSSEQAFGSKSLDVASKTFGCGEPGGHLIRVLTERSVSDDGIFLFYS